MNGFSLFYSGNVFTELNIPVFKNCDQQRLKGIFKRNATVSFKTGDIILKGAEQLNGVYCIKEGVVKVSKTGMDNSEFILWLAQAGDLIGIDSVFSEENKTGYTCKALSAVKICFIPEQEFKLLFSANNNAFMDLVRVLCSRIDTIESRITSIAQKKVKEQLAELLIALGQKSTISGKEKIVVYYSTKDLANIIGTTRNYLYKVLDEFVDKHILIIEKRKILINDWAQLLTVARSSKHHT